VLADLCFLFLFVTRVGCCLCVIPRVLGLLKCARTQKKRLKRATHKRAQRTSCRLTTSTTPSARRRSTTPWRSTWSCHGRAIASTRRGLSAPPPTQLLCRPGTALGDPWRAGFSCAQLAPPSHRHVMCSLTRNVHGAVSVLSFGCWGDFFVFVFACGVGGGACARKRGARERRRPSPRPAAFDMRGLNKQKLSAQRLRFFSRRICVHF
jgi:hypothetical protein